MTDIVVDGYIKSFVESFGYQNIGESEQFERFCFYSLLSNATNQTLNTEDLDDISIEKNKGIDGISFVINGKLVKDTNDVDEFKTSKMSIDVYFIQAKKSGSFNDSEIGSFLDTVIDFLSDTPRYSLTDEAQRYRNVYISIIKNYLRLVKEFNFYAFYCCLGGWNQNTSCAATIQTKQTDIKNRKIFNQVEISPIDRAKLLDKYKKASNPISAEFEFTEKREIKDVPFVEAAYIGLLPFSEYKKIIIDPDNGKLRSLFYDNVRDFLGLDNEVNEKIQKTLDDKRFAEFALLNNGITIIASENTGRADKFIIHNYQIVNGCQTSNVLYECRYSSDIDKTKIPVKLIITPDENLRDRIILSTNNQSSIKEEELLALTEFQKKLEEYYKSAKDGVYYERRNNQYASVGVKQISVVDIREQIKSFAAMFLNIPHEVSGQFGKVFKEGKYQIFNSNHLLEPYYISGLIQHRFKEFLNLKQVDRKYNKARYHVFMLFRMLVESKKYDNNFLSNSREIKAYFEKLLNVIKDGAVCLSNFQKVFKIIDSSGIDIQNRKEIYKMSTTITLTKEFNEKEHG